jgi:hypothetical protein
VDYSSLPEALQIELVQQIQNGNHREPLGGRQDKEEYPDSFYTERTETLKHPPIETKADALIVLHLRSTAPPEVIKATYRALAQLMHPDRGGDEEDFKHLQRAYEVLTKSQQ